MYSWSRSKFLNRGTGDSLAGCSSAFFSGGFSVFSASVESVVFLSCVGSVCPQTLTAKFMQKSKVTHLNRLIRAVRDFWALHSFSRPPMVAIPRLNFKLPGAKKDWTHSTPATLCWD